MHIIVHSSPLVPSQQYKHCHKSLQECIECLVRIDSIVAQVHHVRLNIEFHLIGKLGHPEEGVNVDEEQEEDQEDAYVLDCLAYGVEEVLERGPVLGELEESEKPKDTQGSDDLAVAVETVG